MRMRRTTLSFVACLALRYFSTLSYKQHDYSGGGGSVIEHKMCFDIPFCLKHLILGKIPPDIITNVHIVGLYVEASRNVMAHALKPDFVFRRNGRVHLNRRGASVQSTTGSRGVRISGSNAGYTMFRGSVKEYRLPTPFASFPFTSPPVRHSVPSHFNWTLPYILVTV